LQELAKSEGATASALVATWKDSDIKAITAAFETALRSRRISLVVSSSISLPALGNRVAKACVKGFNRHLSRYKLRPCGGQGYPDTRLERLKDGQSFAFEIIAKSSFNPADTNRVVLTCGTNKLRRSFDSGRPIYHLLATVLYKRVRQGPTRRIFLKGMRLDFLEPWSPVQTRYESSVNHHLLSRGRHKSRLLDAPARKL
jgi:hypothetical protein